MPSVNYVKFQRGLLSAFNAQKERDILDNNTLYFVYENSESVSGQLYLGKKLISGVGQGTSVTSLKDLNDVLVDATASAGSILVLNSEGKWVTSSLQDIADLIASQQTLGFQVDTNIFNLSPIDGSSLKKLFLNGFAEADSGAYAMKGPEGTLIWDKTPSILSTKVSNLETEIENIGDEIARQIANANHLKYQKINNISEATSENIIYLLAKEGTEEDSYDEYMVLNGTLERLGNWGVNLSDYATVAQLNAVDSKFDNYVLTTDFNTTVGNLESYTDYNAGDSIVDILNEINDRLIWQEITG